MIANRLVSRLRKTTATPLPKKGDKIVPLHGEGHYEFIKRVDSKYVYYTWKKEALDRKVLLNRLQYQQGTTTFFWRELA